MVTLDEQINLLKTIGADLERKIEALVIGGSAMMFLGAKTETKDIDLVLMREEDFLLIKKILKKNGFTEKRLRIIRGDYEPKINPTFLEGMNTRFDLFFKEVVCIKITESILERVKEVHQFGKLVVKVLSPEDIILMKCTTERTGDRDDGKSLVEKFKINWDIILEESLRQTKIGDSVFPVFLYDFLVELKEDLKVDIPKDVILKIMKIAEEEIIKAKKQPFRKALAEKIV
ncbi:MAG: nucleotidyltransferase [Candidatus Woesearchaeota archaeon]